MSLSHRYIYDGCFSSGDCLFWLDRTSYGSHANIKDSFIFDFNSLYIHMKSERPSRIIIGNSTTLWIFLNAENFEDEVKIRLIHADNIGSFWKLSIFELYRSLYLMRFDSPP